MSDDNPNINSLYHCINCGIRISDELIEKINENQGTVICERCGLQQFIKIISAESNSSVIDEITDYNEARQAEKIESSEEINEFSTNQLDRDKFGYYLTIFACRYIYDEIKRSNLGLEATNQCVEMIANSVIIEIPNKKIEKDWLNEFKPFKRRLRKNYKEFQKKLRSDPIYRQNFLGAFRFLTKIIFGLINKKDYYGLQGIEFDIAEDLVKRDLFVADHKFKLPFRYNLRLGLSRIVYLKIKDIAHKSNLRFCQLKLTNLEKRDIADEFVNYIIGHDQIIWDFLGNLERIQPRAFNEVYDQFCFELKSDNLFAESFNYYLRTLVGRIRDICCGRYKWKELCHFDRLIKVKLQQLFNVEVDFDQIGKNDKQIQNTKQTQSDDDDNSDRIDFDINTKPEDFNNKKSVLFQTNKGTTFFVDFNDLLRIILCRYFYFSLTKENVRKSNVKETLIQEVLSDLTCAYEKYDCSQTGSLQDYCNFLNTEKKKEILLNYKGPEISRIIKKKMKNKTYLPNYSAYLKNHSLEAVAVNPKKLHNALVSFYHTLRHPEKKPLIERYLNILLNFMVELKSCLESGEAVDLCELNKKVHLYKINLSFNQARKLVWDIRKHPSIQGLLKILPESSYSIITRQFGLEKMDLGGYVELKNRVSERLVNFIKNDCSQLQILRDKLLKVHYFLEPHNKDEQNKFLASLYKSEFFKYNNINNVTEAIDIGGAKVHKNTKNTDIASINGIYDTFSRTSISYVKSHIYDNIKFGISDLKADSQFLERTLRTATYEAFISVRQWLVRAESLKLLANSLNSFFSMKIDSSQHDSHKDNFDKFLLNEPFRAGRLTELLKTLSLNIFGKNTNMSPHYLNNYLGQLRNLFIERNEFFSEQLYGKLTTNLQEYFRTRLLYLIEHYYESKPEVNGTIEGFTKNVLSSFYMKQSGIREQIPEDGIAIYFLKNYLKSVKMRSIRLVKQLFHLISDNKRYKSKKSTVQEQKLYNLFEQITRLTNVNIKALFKKLKETNTLSLEVLLKEFKKQRDDNGSRLERLKGVLHNIDYDMKMLVQEEFQQELAQYAASNPSFKILERLFHPPTYRIKLKLPCYEEFKRYLRAKIRTQVCSKFIELFFQDSKNSLKRALCKELEDISNHIYTLLNPPRFRNLSVSFMEEQNFRGDYTNPRESFVEITLNKGSTRAFQIHDKKLIKVPRGSKKEKIYENRIAYLIIEKGAFPLFPTLTQAKDTKTVLNLPFRISKKGSSKDSDKFGGVDLGLKDFGVVSVQKKIGQNYAETNRYFLDSNIFDVKFDRKTKKLVHRNRFEPDCELMNRIYANKKKIRKLKAKLRVKYKLKKGESINRLPANVRAELGALSKENGDLRSQLFCKKTNIKLRLSRNRAEQRFYQGNIARYKGEIRNIFPELFNYLEKASFLRLKSLRDTIKELLARNEGNSIYRKELKNSALSPISMFFPREIELTNQLRRLKNNIYRQYHLERLRKRHRAITSEIVHLLAHFHYEICKSHEISLFRMENLKWSRHSSKSRAGQFLASWQVNWFYSRVQESTKGLLDQYSIGHELVPAKGTSYRCCYSGAKGNRSAQVFGCDNKKCPVSPHLLNADLNAARNVCSNQVPLLSST